MDTICINDLRKSYGLRPLSEKEANERYCSLDLSSQKDQTGYFTVCIPSQGGVKIATALAEWTVVQLPAKLSPKII